MNISGCKVVPVEVRNIPTVLTECILSNTNCSKKLQLSSYATTSTDIIKIGSSLNRICDACNECITKMVVDTPIPQNTTNAPAPGGTPPRRFGSSFLISAIRKKMPCPGATRRGVAPTPIRGWGSSRCRGLEAAAHNQYGTSAMNLPTHFADEPDFFSNISYPYETAKNQKKNTIIELSTLCAGLPGLTGMTKIY